MTFLLTLVHHVCHLLMNLALLYNFDQFQPTFNTILFGQQMYNNLKKKQKTKKLSNLFSVLCILVITIV